MGRAFLAVLALALLAAPAAAVGNLAAPDAALPVVHAVGSPTDLVLRQDPDGNSTLLLNVEDGVGGTYVYTRVATPPAVPNARETGVFAHSYALADGTPMVALGVYASSQATNGLVRVPLVLLENVASVPDLQAQAGNLVADAQQQANPALHYAQEIILPELTRYFAEPYAASAVSGYRDYPTVYVWTVHRSGPAGEVWAGQYLARTGTVETDANGRVAFAEKDAEFGVAVRDAAGVTTRVAGAFVTETLTADADAESSRQSATFVAGAAAADGTRVPLGGVRFTDERAGEDLAMRPRVQSTDGAVGVVGPDGAFVPLAGVATEAAYAPSSYGWDVTRVSSVGVYAEDRYVPLAGVRYHSDAEEVEEVALRIASDGLGAPENGNFEIDVGAFPDGAYAPVAGFVHRNGFREASHANQAFMAVGAYSPLGFHPVLASSYDGSLPLTPWAYAFTNGNGTGERWMLAAGTVAAGEYLPLVGVQAIGSAPLGEREVQQEVRVGVFAASYRRFVPVASLAYDGDESPVAHANAVAAQGGPGAEAGEFDVRAGAYAADQYVGLAGLQFRSDFDGGDDAETLVVVGAYALNEFVPLAGVAYESGEPLLPSLNAPANLRDDAPSRVTAGVYVMGEFVPVVEVRNTAEDVRVTPLP